MRIGSTSDILRHAFEKAVEFPWFFYWLWPARSFLWPRGSGISALLTGWGSKFGCQKPYHICELCEYSWKGCHFLPCPSISCSCDIGCSRPAALPSLLKGLGQLDEPLSKGQTVLVEIDLRSCGLLIFSALRWDGCVWKWAIPYLNEENDHEPLEPYFQAHTHILVVWCCLMLFVVGMDFRIFENHRQISSFEHGCTEEAGGVLGCGWNRMNLIHSDPPSLPQQLCWILGCKVMISPSGLGGDSQVLSLFLKSGCRDFMRRNYQPKKSMISYE